MAKTMKHTNFPRGGGVAKTDQPKSPHGISNKYPDPTLCIECGALYAGGRWSWDDIPENVSNGVCPACQRIADKSPAGVIQLSGTYYNQHREEIMKLVKKIKIKAITLRPLERIMEIQSDDEQSTIQTTGTDIALKIGEGLHNAFGGELNCRNEGDDRIHVNWKR